jgi:hypothetical protein
MLCSCRSRGCRADIMFHFRNFVARPINVLLSGRNDHTILVEKPEAKKPVGRPNIATL